MLSGERLGVTPLTTQLVRSTAPRTITLTLPGFAPASTTASLTSDFTWSARLVPRQP
jgi:hypothetical protein